MHLKSRANSLLTIGFSFAFAYVAPAIAQTTVYSDTFTRAGQLAGTAPDVRPGSETWSTYQPSFYSTDGAAASSTTAYPYAAWLPLSVSNGVTYSASVSVNMAATGEWVALGFLWGGDMVGGSGGPWLLLRNNGGAQLWAASAFLDLPSGTYSAASTHTLRLDYTRSANASAVARYYIDGSLLTTVDYTSAPTITRVGVEFNSQPTTTKFDNFSVTATAVPEPSTYAALAGVAMLGFAALRRRNQRLR